MIVRRVFPTAGEPIDLDVPDARDLLTALYEPSRPGQVRLNLIGSVSGSATGSDGTSESLTNSADRMILKAIRSLADIVVVGATTVRREGYFIPRSGALAVVTRSGDLSQHRLKGTSGAGTLVILCPAAAVEAVTATAPVADARIVVVADSDRLLGATSIVDALRHEGYASIVAEGGPQLARLFITGGVVDELCLTTSPVLNGGVLPLFGPGEFAEHPLALSQLLVDDGGATYARWALADRP